MTGAECEHVRVVVRSGTVEPTPEVAAHLATCAACSVLWDSPELRAVLAPSPSAAAVDVASVLEAVHAEGPPRSMATLRVVAMGGLALVAVAWGLARRRPDLAALPPLPLGAVLASWAVVAAWATVLVSRPPWRAEASSALRGATLLLVWAAPLLALVPLGPGTEPPGFVVPLFACFGYGAVGVAATLAVLWFAFRRHILLAGRWPLMAATGAVVGNGALLLHCSLTDPAHLLAAHVALGVVMSAVAALVGVIPARRRRASGGG